MKTITTRAAIPSAREGDIVDYTRFRIGGRIVRCPSCGEKGDMVRLPPPHQHPARALICHRMQHIGWAWAPPRDCNPPARESSTPDDCILDAAALAEIEGPP